LILIKFLSKKTKKTLITQDNAILEEQIGFLEIKKKIMLRQLNLLPQQPLYNQASYLLLGIIMNLITGAKFAKLAITNHLLDLLEVVQSWKLMSIVLTFFQVKDKSKLNLKC